MNDLNRCLGFVNRNLRQCPKQVKAQAYTALVRPILEYASAAWDPHHKYKINKIEQIQRRAARIATNCWSQEKGCVSNALQELEWVSLESRRKQSRLTHLYKAINTDTSTIRIPSYFTQRHNARSTRSCNEQKFINPRTQTDIYKYSFFPRTICEWNSLPNDIVNFFSLDGFRTALMDVLWCENMWLSRESFMCSMNCKNPHLHQWAIRLLQIIHDREDFKNLEMLAVNTYSKSCSKMNKIHINMSTLMQKVEKAKSMLNTLQVCFCTDQWISTNRYVRIVRIFLSMIGFLNSNLNAYSFTEIDIICCILLLSEVHKGVNPLDLFHFISN